MADAGLDMLWGLVLESGSRWGEVAAPFQREDAEAIFGDAGPKRHFLTRGRGGSKTTDLAGIVLAWLAVEAPPRARGYVVASNADQAAILVDAAAGFVARTPELDGVLEVQNERLVAPNQAWVRVLSLSDSGAWGLRDAHFLILDEFAQWPETRGAKRVYTAVRSTVQKTPGCRLVILTSAGEPSHWSFTEVFEKAKADPTWRVAETPGPVPWQDPVELDALRRELRPSEYQRLILNQWAEDEDRAISEEDWLAAAEPDRVRAPAPDVRYILAVDIGISMDASVVVVAHSEPVFPDDPRSYRRVVVDRVQRWKGSKRRPVQLATVEDWVVRTALEYNGARVYADPTQFRGHLQNVRRRGVRADEWPFTATSVGQVATALVLAFRNRQIVVPDRADLREELLRVRLRESAPGVTRLDHDRGAHDDQAVTLGMACHILLAGTGYGPAAMFRDVMRRKAEANAEAGLRDPTRGALARQHRRRTGSSERIEAARAARQRRCEHRWRGSICVFCGAADAEDPSMSVP